MKKLKICLGLAVSIVCVVFLVLRIDFNTFTLYFNSVNIKFLILGGALILLNFCLHAIRWQFLIVPQTLHFMKAFTYLMIGTFVNVILPFRPGDVLRIVLIQKLFSKNASIAAIGSITVERLFDLLTLLLFGVILAFIIPLPVTFKVMLNGFALFAAAIITALICLCINDQIFKKLFFVILKPFGIVFTSKVINIFDQFYLNIRTITSLNCLLITALLSFISWACVAFSMVCFVAAFDPNISVMAGILLMVVTNLGAAIPASPGSIGVYHALCVLTLSLWNVDYEKSLAIAIVSHTAIISIQVIGGIVSIWFEGGFSKVSSYSIKTSCN